MKHCGYCEIDTEDPCTNSMAAMNCTQDLNDAGIKNQSARIEAEADAVIDKRAELMDKRVELMSLRADGNMTPPKPVRLEDRHTVPGIKFDEGKPRMDLIPPELNKAVATILAFGAGKYGDRNWEKGLSWGRVFAAMMRHLWAWWGGERKDAESGYSPLWHAGCCLAFLIAYEERGTGTDDRNNLKDTK